MPHSAAGRLQLRLRQPAGGAAAAAPAAPPPVPAPAGGPHAGKRRLRRGGVSSEPRGCETPAPQRTDQVGNGPWQQVARPLQPGCEAQAPRSNQGQQTKTWFLPTASTHAHARRSTHLGEVEHGRCCRVWAAAGRQATRLPLLRLAGSTRHASGGGSTPHAHVDRQVLVGGRRVRLRLRCVAVVHGVQAGERARAGLGCDHNAWGAARALPRMSAGLPSPCLRRAWCRQQQDGREGRAKGSQAWLECDRRARRATSARAARRPPRPHRPPPAAARHAWHTSPPCLPCSQHLQPLPWPLQRPAASLARCAAWAAAPAKLAPWAHAAAHPGPNCAPESRLGRLRAPGSAAAHKEERPARGGALEDAGAQIWGL